jgi:ankyrin repeat protein
MSRRRLVVQASQLREELDKLPPHAVVAIELPPAASDADAPLGPLSCVSAELRTQSLLVLSPYEMSTPDTALFDAIQRNDPAGCVAAIGAGADIEARDGRSPLLDYDTPLLSAAASPELVRLLLERGADPKARSGSGWTPLIRACKRQLY